MSFGFRPENGYNVTMNDVEEVKQRLDIVEVIGGYVELKKAGKDYRGLSPFRTEKTPSFFVSPDKQIWHDFGANEGGDIISFVMRVEGLSFPEALEMLAARAGVELKPRSGRGPSGEQKNRLYSATDLAMKFYHYQLSQHTAALEYVREQRGIAADTIKAFRLGYAPGGWSTFTDYALAKGYTLEELVKAGLSGNRPQGGGYDVFRERVMFPVFDAQGRAIGFSGRLLAADAKAAKYVNTTETPIYHKSTALYGLAQAKDAIRKADFTVLVEGNVDVVMIWQAGTQNVVASSGTALTEDQIKILGRLAPTIKLCFDQDAAGLKATLKGIEAGQRVGVRIEVVTYSGAKDPDELIRKDPDAWKEALEKAEYSFDYLFRYAAETFGVSKGPEKKATTKFLAPVVAQISDRIEREHYLTRLAQLVQVDSSTIKAAVEGSSTMPVVNTKTAQSNAPERPKKPTGAARLEEMFLEILLAYPEARMALDDLDVEFVQPENAGIFEALLRHPKATIAELCKLLPEEAERVNILGLRGDHEYSALTEHERGLEAFTQVHNLQKHHLNQYKRKLQREIAQAEAQGDRPLATQKLREYQAVVNRVQEF